MNEWIDNEKGPTCRCGRQTFVKDFGDGKYGLLCFTHTAEDGAWFELPKNRPDNFSELTFSDLAEIMNDEEEE